MKLNHCNKEGTMKIAIVCNYPLKKNYTGSDIYNDKLTYSLSHRGNVELHIITIGKENRQFKKDRLIIHTIKKKLIDIPLFHPVLLWQIKRKIMEINPDIVHVISTGLPYSTTVAFLRDKYPTLLTAYGISARETKYYRLDHKTIRKILSYIFSPIFILNERYVLTKIPNIVVDSLSIEDLVSKWTKFKIYVVSAGIEYEKVQKIQSHNLLNGNCDVFFVCNLEKIKGGDILIKALQIVINSIPNLSVYIAGSGPQEKELKTLVKKLNLENYVKFLGFISNEEKYQYYKACKVVVVPSRWDCQPAALFDAAASEKPAIASDMANPGIIEEGKTGFIFKSEDIKDLASKMIVLLKNEKLREEMGKAAKAKVKQYDWNQVAERYIEIYKEAIADFHERKIR